MPSENAEVRDCLSQDFKENVDEHIGAYSQTININPQHIDTYIVSVIFSSECIYLIVFLLQLCGSTVIFSYISTTCV